MIEELNGKHKVVYDKENIEIFQTTELRYIYKVMNEQLVYYIGSDLLLDGSKKQSICQTASI
jgi:catabolite regulation protein CreA